MGCPARRRWHIHTTTYHNTGEGVQDSKARRPGHLLWPFSPPPPPSPPLLLSLPSPFLSLPPASQDRSSVSIAQPQNIYIWATHSKGTQQCARVNVCVCVTITIKNERSELGGQGRRWGEQGSKWNRNDVSTVRVHVWHFQTWINKNRNKTKMYQLAFSQMIYPCTHKIRIKS